MVGAAPVLVCGLGSLGQACLDRLFSFGVPLRCLDVRVPHWRDQRLAERLSEEMVLGDMREAQALRRAGAHQARAVMLLTPDATVNLEAALQVRLLNPEAQVVVRSSSQSADLAALLEDRLPGIAVVDPVLLTASAINAAVHPGPFDACFLADGQRYAIIKAPWSDHHLQRRIHLSPNATGGPEVLLTPASCLTGSARESSEGSGPLSRRISPSLLRRLKRLISVAPLMRWWLARPPRLLGVIALLLGLLLVGLGLFSRSGGWKQGTFVTLSLLKGEYVDPVNVVLEGKQGLQAMNGWLIGGTLLYSLIGTLLTSALVAVILERLLRERLGVPVSRVLGRHAQPVLLVDGAALARRVGGELRAETIPVVRVQAEGDPLADPRTPTYRVLLEAVNDLVRHELLAAAFLSSDLLMNLHGALAVQRHWPDTRLVILAHDFGAAEPLGEMLGGLTVISTVDLVADSVVATAFGERVEGVLRIGSNNLLLVRYQLVSGDTLCGNSIARLENGYGVTVVSLRRHRSHTHLSLPPNQLMLDAGDQLLVLATMAGLRRIEGGIASAPDSRLRIRGPVHVSPESLFELHQLLARRMGCAIGDVVHLLDGGTHLSPLLDRDVAEQLREELGRFSIGCELIES